VKNKTVLVTGATNGIGEAIAEGLARQGAEVIIVSRSGAKCATTAERIRRETGNPNVRYYAADLSVQAQVRDLTETLNRDLPRLDVLVNNAGAWFTSRQLSADSIEMTWALNHLSYFLLTHGLTDLLKRTAAQHGQARIINQASMAHLDGAMHWDDLQFENSWETKGKGEYGAGWGVYNQSKLANVLHAFALARRLDSSGVVVNATHPSVVVTGFAANNGFIYKLAAPVRRLFNRTTPHDGAAPAIYLASAPEAAAITGAYYGPPHKREDANPIASDVAAQDRLWDISLEQVKLPAEVV
jgi:NAD(P)-dependent dehydrogenase (short-subunit alcohol dehydrogenase family)